MKKTIFTQPNLLHFSCKSLLLLSGLLWCSTAFGQISVFPDVTDFEGEATCGTICGTPCALSNGTWTNDSQQGVPAGVRDWTADIGGTTSSPTGPSVDHTLGTAAGVYLYAETSSPCNTVGNTWNLYSDQFDFTAVANPQLSFWYHFFGATIGMMQVDASVDGGATYANVLPAFGPENVDLWQQQLVCLDAATYGNNPNVRLRISYFDPTGFTADAGIDDIVVADAAIDLAATDLTISPLSCVLTATTSVTVEYTNSSCLDFAAGSTINFSYSVDGGAATNETFVTTAPLVIGASATFTFAVPTDLSAGGTYSIQVDVNAVGDTNGGNNTITDSVINPGVSISTFPYTEDFEAGAGGWSVVNVANSSWELATPATTIINSANSGINAWVTNATGDYNGSEDGYVQSPCFDFSTLCQPEISMFVWWESEFSWDGAVLQSSIDGGGSWQNVGAFGDPDNWYTDNTINGNPGGQQEGWTGRDNTANGSGGYVEAIHALDGLAGEGQVFLRVAFGSDGSINDEGFAFDDVTIIDAGFNDNLAATAVTVSGPAGCAYGPAETVTLEILNDGCNDILAGTAIPVSYTINAGAPVSETFTLATDLVVGGTDTYVFTTPADLSAVMVYTIDAAVAFAGDPDATNDMTSTMVESFATIAAFPYTEDFEGGAGGWNVVDIGGVSNWELGTPAGGTIVGAASGANAWITGATADYNNDDFSYVQSPCFDFSALCQPELSFNIWWDSENGFDGASVQSSIDGGNTWQNIGAAGDPNNWFNDATINGLDGIPGWTGDEGNLGSGGYVAAVHALDGLGGQASVILRVVFGSDASVNADDGFAFDDISINDAAVPVMVTTAVMNETCEGDMDGSITVTATGGSGTFMYSNDGGATFQAGNVFAGLNDDTYMIVVEDQTSLCTFNETAVIAAGADVSITSVIAANETCEGANDGTLTVTATGTGTLEYSTDGTTFSTDNPITGLADGTYDVTARVVGTTCTDTDAGNVVAPGSDVQITMTASTDETVANADDGTITITANCTNCIGVLEYSIDNGATFQMNGGAYTGLAPGSYMIVVRDNMNTTCTATATETVAGIGCDVAFATQAATDETCDGADDGTITVTGSCTTCVTGFEFSIDGITFQPTGNFTGLADGTYTVTIQDLDDAGCNATIMLTVAAGDNVTITDVAETNETCAGANDGTLTVTATGTGALEYSTDGTTFSTDNPITGLADGTYTVTARVVGTTCTDTDAGNVVAPGSDVQITMTASTDETVFVANDGTITITATCTDCIGTLEYSIDNGATFQPGNVFTGLMPGTYMIVVRDDANITCTATATETIIAAPDCNVAFATETSTDETCDGASDGTITVTGTCTSCATGFEFSIDGTVFQPTGNFTGLADGTYTVTIRDLDDVTCNATTMLTVNAGQTTTISGVATTDETCDGLADGSLTITATGAGTLEYSIDGGATFQASDSFNGLADASYIIVVQPVGQAACAATTTATVGTAADMTPPTAICQDITVITDAAGMVSITAAQINNNSTDNCQLAATTLDITSFDCSNIGDNTVMLIATDASGNSATCTATVTVTGSAFCAGQLAFGNNESGADVNGTDPCTCAAQPGFFDEEVLFGPAVPGLTFVVQGTTLLQTGGTGVPIAAGTNFMETPVAGGQSIYTLFGQHQDGVGYTITVTSPNFPGQVFTFSNRCFYPDPVINTIPADILCLFSDPITLAGSEANGAAGNGTFFIDGVGVTQLDPMTLGLGNYTLTYTFDAGAAANFATVNGVQVPAQVGPPIFVTTLAEAIANPGCEESVSVDFSIVQNNGQLTCNDAIQVSLNENCEALITPDMLLEGDQACYDDFEITLRRNLQPVANPLTGANIGQTIIGTVTFLDNGNSCWTTITVEDKLAPVIACTDVTIACTADPSLIPAPVAMDNCDPNPIETLVDEVINTDNNCNGTPPVGFDPFTVTIVRTYIAVDNQGNTSATCQQEITVIRPTTVDIPDDLVWSCEQYAAYPYIIGATRLMPGIANQFGGVIQPLANSNAWDLTGIALTDARLTNNVPGTTMPTGSGVPSGIFPLPNGNANPLGGDLAAEYCKYAYTSADQVLSTCDYAASLTSPVFKVVRTWTVLDWCTGNVATNLNPLDADAVQVIKVIDNTPPLVVGADVTVSANIQGQHPQPCKGQGPILMGTATDNCTGPATNLQGFVYSSLALNSAVAQVTPTGNGFGILNPALPVGAYFVVWSATDACGNSGQSTAYQLNVIDNIVPTAVCDEITQVALSSDGLAVVYAGTFDDGSYDNCCLDRLEVRRMGQTCGINGNTTFDNDGDPQDSPSDPDNGEFVTFCCSDIGNTNMVVLRVFDCSDNYNECMVEVLVEDKLAPIITCPPNASITCDNFADNLLAGFLACQDLTGAAQDVCQSDALTAAGYGTATAFDNCEATITPTVSGFPLNQCGVGTITRSFSAVDPSGNGGTGQAVCTQTISITTVSDWVVEFPANVDLDCETDEADIDFGEPEIFFETCELIATSFEDQIFDIVADACFKITRQWTVINWCVVGDVIDQEPAAIELSEAQLVAIIGFAAADLDGDGDRDTRTFRDSYRGILPTSDNDPDVDTQDGFITYQQVIKVDDTVAPVIDAGFALENQCIITGNNGTNNDFSGCVFSGVLPTPTYDDCILDVNGETEDGEVIDNAVIITARVFDAAGNIVSNSVVVNNLAIGCYTVRYTAIDRCGNTSIDEYDFCVEDCKLPTPYCKDGVVLELMAINDPNNTTFVPMVELWAVDLDLGSFDNCAGAVQLSFSANVNDIGVQYTCDNVGENEVELWVTDASGNQDFCTTFVIIQANQGQCPTDDPQIAGNVATEANADVQDVTVAVNSTTGFGATQTTLADGNFNFAVPANGDYTITPSKDMNPRNGVTTFDLVTISKHILNVESLDSPYKMIAADANNSGTITTLDLVQVRKLILFIDNEFSNNSSWRFVDASYNFPNANNPWAEAFPEIINLNNVTANELNNNFVAVKIGDVNGSANANQLLGADDRTVTGALTLTAADVALKAGETHTVEVSAANFNNFGYQFTMNFDANALEFVEAGNGLATADNFGYSLLSEGAITASWNESAAVRMAADETVFTMTFVAKTDVQLSDVLSINSRYTTAEAYAANGDVQNVELNFNSTSATAGFELYQNAPNPFREETKIGFNLPAAQNATITVSDVSGKVLSVISQDFDKGYNEVILNSENLNATGVLYYQVETAEDSATKMMVLMK